MISRSRIAAALTVPVVLWSAPASDPWETWRTRQAMRMEYRIACPWAAIYADPATHSRPQDPDLRALWEQGECEVTQIPAEAAQALWKRRGWGPGPRWFLMDEHGEIRSEHEGPLDGAALLAALKAAGWRSSSNTLTAFLKEFPDHGPARLTHFSRLGYDAIRRQRALARAMNPRPNTPEARQALVPPGTWEALHRALKAYLAVEGWESQPPGLFTSPLRWMDTTLGAHRHPLLQAPLAKARVQIEEALAENPHDPWLWGQWYSCFPDQSPLPVKELLDRLHPVPGYPWPPAVLASSLCGPLASAKEWGELLALSGSALQQAQKASALPPTDDPETFRQRNHEEWGRWQWLALSALGRSRDARELAEELSRHADDPRAFLSFLGELAKAHPEADASHLEHLKNQQAPPPPAPRPPREAPSWTPVRLAVIGRPPWLDTWTSMKEHRAFDDWTPGQELQWASLDPKEIRALEARLGWGPEPRWVALKGNELLATGTAPPRADELESRISAHAVPRLRTLHTYLAAHPRCTHARLERLEKLRPRMPHPRLEALLREDVQATMGSFLVETEGEQPLWKPEGEDWERAALAVLPRLEETLRRWPTDPRLWAAWADWSLLHPRRPSAARLLDSIGIWNDPLLDNLFQLPEHPVVSTLRRRQQWKELAAFCEILWERKIRPILSRRMPGTTNSPTLQLQKFQEVSLRTQFFNPWAEALQRTGQRLLRQRVEDELDATQAGLAARLLPPGEITPPTN